MTPVSLMAAANPGPCGEAAMFEAGPPCIQMAAVPERLPAMTPLLLIPTGKKLVPRSMIAYREGYPELPTCAPPLLGVDPPANRNDGVTARTIVVPQSKNRS